MKKEKELLGYIVVISIFLLAGLIYTSSLDKRVLELENYKFNSATHKEVEEVIEKCRVLKSKYMKKECQIIVVVNDK